MAAAAKAEDGKKSGPSLVVQLGVLVVLTLAAIATGWVTGGKLAPATDRTSAAHAAAPAHEGGEEGAEDAPNPLPNVVTLEPVTTNLAAPSSVWARLEIALVFKDQPDPMLAQTIHQDMIAFMRTLKLSQIKSPSGFQHLKSDLKERAVIRSQGRVTDVLIKSLLFE